MSIRLSACTLGYNRQTTIEEAVRRIANAGYKAVDLYTGAPHAWPQDFTKSERDALKRQILAARFEIDRFRRRRRWAGTPVQL